MKLIISLTLALLCTSVAGCGDSAKKIPPTVSTAASVALPRERTITGDYDEDDYGGTHYGDADNDDNKPTDRDNDSDNATGSYYDSDDNSVRYFGHVADATDRHAITTLVRRYYAVAVAQDGATGCSMIIAGLAKSVAEDLGGPQGPPYLRGNSCATVLSKTFRLNRLQLGAEEHQLQITAVRIDGNAAVALIGFKTLPGRALRLLREAGTWKLEGLLDSELP